MVRVLTTAVAFSAVFLVTLAYPYDVPEIGSTAAPGTSTTSPLGVLPNNPACQQYEQQCKGSQMAPIQNGMGPIVGAMPGGGGQIVNQTADCQTLENACRNPGTGVQPPGMNNTMPGMPINGTLPTGGNMPIPGNVHMPGGFNNTMPNPGGLPVDPSNPMNATLPGYGQVPVPGGR